MFVTVYLFALGLLLAQYTITGFDASAHVSEETVGARTEAPKAIVRAIYISAIAAFFLNLAMTAGAAEEGRSPMPYAGDRVRRRQRPVPRQRRAEADLVSASVPARPSSWCSSASSPSSSAAWRRSPPTAA